MASQPLFVMSLTPPPQYAPEPCGYCAGKGLADDQVCEACGGQRKVFVHQPSLACPRCRGTGKATDQDRANYYSRMCIVCRGTGWALTLHG